MSYSALMTPQASRAPELPVGWVLKSSLFVDMESMLAGAQTGEIGNQVHAVLLLLEGCLALDGATMGRIHDGHRCCDRRSRRGGGRSGPRLVAGMGVGQQPQDREASKTENRK